ncbi:MAG: alpha/beta hydrolase [Rhodospirillales bacterium]|nr:alpha/beta hydrolase [Rhodospirillales bacterium]MBO6787976.1 alpha/beta hydrolase [Rhodospirillales bacterium]
MSFSLRLPRALALLTSLMLLSACAGTTGSPGILAHEVTGTGPEKVIVLHDWLGDRRNYDDARPYLDMKGYTYAFTDLRGYGGSVDKTGAFTAAEAASDTLALADYLGWQRFHIVGHSMTGMVVQRIAADAPERVISVIATTPVAANGMQTDKDTRGFLEGAAKDPAVMAKAIHALTGNRLADTWASFKVERAISSSTEAARLAYLDMFDKENFHGDVEGLDVPITVILGENDLPFFQPDYIKSTFGKWYPNLKIVVSPNAGHYVMQETPAFYASAVVSHLKENALK